MPLWNVAAPASGVDDFPQIANTGSMKQKFACAFLALFITLLAAKAPMATEMDVRLRAAFDAGELAGLHGVLVLHRGETVAETYFPGKDESWGMPLGVVQHGPEELHDLRSVTKSIVGLLYGIALAEGKVPPLDAALIEQFPQYRDLSADPARKKMTIGDALSMRIGTQWNENLPYSDPSNSEIAMENAPDRYRFVLDRPMAAEPGTQWTYNGGAVAVIAKLIADGVGKPIDRYAKERLFAPLGIDRFEWAHGSDGEPSAASGLRLTARDLARIGELVLGKGKYGDAQIVPEEWLSSSFQPLSETSEGARYGYLWWLAPWGEPPAWVAGFGNGGQRITIQASVDLIVVVFAGNYNQHDAWKVPVRVIEDFVVPEIRRRLGK